MVLKPQEVPEDVFLVLETYKLTWFSNRSVRNDLAHGVLDPYKLTWFSNTDKLLREKMGVLDPYKLTWFSNPTANASNVSLF